MWGPQTLGRGLEEVFAWESPWPQAAGQLPPSSCLPCRSGGPHRDVALGAGSPGTPKGRHPVLHVQVSAPLSELPDQGGPHGSITEALYSAQTLSHSPSARHRRPSSSPPCSLSSPSHSSLHVPWAGLVLAGDGLQPLSQELSLAPATAVTWLISA